MLSVTTARLSSTDPIVGFELKALIGLTRTANNSYIIRDVTELNPIDGHFLKYKWYRVQNDGKGAVCCLHPTEQANIQCLECLKAHVSVADSYHCSPQCFYGAWKHHIALHQHARTPTNTSTSSSSSSSHKSKPLGMNMGERERWVVVGQSRNYTPTIEDIGHVLQFECVIVNSATKYGVGPATLLSTSPVSSADPSQGSSTRRSSI